MTFFVVNRYNRNVDIRYLQPLLLLSTVCAILPPYSFAENKIRHRIKYKIYCVILSVLMITGTAYGFYWRITVMDRRTKGSVTVLNHLLSLLSLLNALTIMLYVPFKYADAYRTFLDNFSRFDRKLNLPSLRRYNSLYMRIAFTLSILVLLLSTELYNWALNRRFDYLMLATEKVQCFHFMIFLLVLRELTAVFRHRFENVNNQLVLVMERSILRRNTASSKCCKTNVKMTKLLMVMSYNGHRDQVEEIGKLYGMLCDQMKKFNDMFGNAILHAMNTVVVNLLVTINLALLISSGQVQLNKDYSLLTAFSAWTCALLFMAITIASTCQATVREARRTYAICIRYYYDFPMESESKLDDELQNTVLILSQQVASRVPRFSAGGFFDVDHTMLFSCLTQITTYMVALIQFNNIA